MFYQTTTRPKLEDKPVYLVELMHPLTGDILFADVCSRLDVAVEQVFNHFDKFSSVNVVPRPSYDEDTGEVEGIGFFSSAEELISCITAYHMSRDSDLVTNPFVAAACADWDAHNFERSLVGLFNRKS